MAQAARPPTRKSRGKGLPGECFLSASLQNHTVLFTKVTLWGWH